jgi:hypothetical protein
MVWHHPEQRGLVPRIAPQANAPSRRRSREAPNERHQMIVADPAEEGRASIPCKGIVDAVEGRGSLRGGSCRPIEPREAGLLERSP